MVGIFFNINSNIDPFESSPHFENEDGLSTRIANFIKRIFVKFIAKIENTQPLIIKPNSNPYPKLLDKIPLDVIEIVNCYLGLPDLSEFSRTNSQLNKLAQGEMERAGKKLFKSLMIGSDFYKELGIEVEEEPTLPNNWFKLLKSPSKISGSKGSIMSDHIVIMISKKMNKSPTTLLKYFEIFTNLMPPQFTINAYHGVVDQYGESEIEHSFWLALSKKVLPKTEGRRYEKQKEIIENSGYKVPELLPALIGITMHYLKTKKTSYGKTYDDDDFLPYPKEMETVCKEKLHNENAHTAVGALNSKEMNVGFISTAFIDAGMAGMLIL